jgi:hypothetical protein
MTAAKICGAAKIGILCLAAIIANAFAISCADLQGGSDKNANEIAFNISRAPAPSDTERYCAWYGSSRDDVLFFGQAAFWSSYHAAGGRPRADLDRRGPQQIGRFDLEREELLPPLETGVAEARSGVWDVLAHPNGRVYFTTYFESAGYVDPASGRVSLFENLGAGLNELALGPRQNLLVSRYGRADGGSGSVLVFDPDGRPLREYPLSAAAGFVLAPKTVAYDPVADEIWVTTDLLVEDPETGSTSPAVAGHPTLILSRDGRVRARISAADDGVPDARPQTGGGEVQFVHFDAAGRGYIAVVEDARLELHLLSPSEPERSLAGTRGILLDTSFPSEFDFVQDLQIAEDGRVIVTRWSGAIHVVTPGGDPQVIAFPRPSEGGLYYTAVARGGRVCATYCADVTVVCGPAP